MTPLAVPPSPRPKNAAGSPNRPHPTLGASCRARDDLVPSALATLVERTGSTLEQALPDEQRWQGRRVRVVDGTGLTLPETPANQEA